MDYKFSLYQNQKGFSASDLTVENYIGMVQHGANQDLVLQARCVKEDKDKYKELKSNSLCITGSAIFESGKSKKAENIKALNGLIVLDIDTEISDEKFHEIKKLN